MRRAESEPHCDKLNSAGTSSEGTINSSEKRRFSLFNVHRELLEKAQRRKEDNYPHQDDITDEISLYFKSSFAPLKSDPIGTWLEMASLYPNLIKVALKYLNVAATSVPCERLFSRTGQIMNEKRNRLKGSTLNKILFLGKIDKTFWRKNFYKVNGKIFKLNKFLRRVGNIYNELGVLYMNQATSRYQPENKDSSAFSSEVTALLERSRTNLEAGLKSFATVRDESNLALPYANINRLLRLKAHIHVKQPAEEHQFYKKAFTIYQKALQDLGVRKCNHTIWNNVTWDFSTTLNTMVTYSQDYPVAGNKSEQELEREVVEILQRARKYCEVAIPAPRQPICQFRAATIHHRLACLYYRMYRGLNSETEIVRRKTASSCVK